MPERLHSGQCSQGSFDLCLTRLNTCAVIVSSRIVEEEADERDEGGLECPPNGIPPAELVQLSRRGDVLDRDFRYFAALFDSGSLLGAEGNVGDSAHGVAQQRWSVDEHPLIIVSPSHDCADSADGFVARFVVFQDGWQVIPPFQELYIRMGHLLVLDEWSRSK